MEVFELISENFVGYRTLKMAVLLTFLRRSALKNSSYCAAVNGFLPTRNLRNSAENDDSFNLSQVEKIIKDEIQNVENDLPDPTIINPYTKEVEKCILCKYNVELDYKNPRLLSQFVSRFTGRVYDKHVTGLCKIQQERVKKAVELSQCAGFMPYEFKDVKYINDPKLFDISNINLKKF